MADARLTPKLKQDDRRSCGHPSQPTWDLISENGRVITSYCIPCLIKKLAEFGIHPCSKCKVGKVEDWAKPEKIIWVFNR